MCPRFLFVCLFNRFRYRKGKKSILGNLWWEMHEECMVICAEALIPLAITAVFTTGGPHNTEHAKWGERRMYVCSKQLSTVAACIAARRVLSIEET